jgi:hypothetical protein
LKNGVDRFGSAGGRPFNPEGRGENGAEDEEYNTEPDRAALEQ